MDPLSMLRFVRVSVGHLTRRFPYAVFFSVEGAIVVILAVVHTARDPDMWQLRVE
jgi:hypothetical protein